MTSNHNGRGLFTQNILQSNIFLCYITTLQQKSPTQPKIQNSTGIN